MIYISLGWNCEPRIQIKKKYGLYKSNGYKTCPFDLCMTPFENLKNCLKDDFKFFFDDLHLIQWPKNVSGDRSKCGSGKMVICNKYNMILNHESSVYSHKFLSPGQNDDFYYTRNNFELFKKRYINRINNYREYIKNYNKITFIHSDQSKKEWSCEKHNEFKNFLKELYPKKEIYLQILHNY